MSANHNLKEKLIEFLGSDRFQRFCFALQKNNKLYYWQEKVIKELSVFLNTPLPTDIQFWKNLLKDSITNKTLSEYEVPHDQYQYEFDKHMNELLKGQLPSLNFTSNKYGWRAEILDPTIQCFGLRVGVQINTRNIPSLPAQLPEVDERQAALTALILSDLPRLISVIESKMEARERAIDEAYLEKLSNPHIDIGLEDCPDRDCSPHIRNDLLWTFVCERNDDPDYGYHFEFDGTQFIRLWSGD